MIMTLTLTFILILTIAISVLYLDTQARKKESMTNNNNNLSSSFCDYYKTNPGELEKASKLLTQENCMNSSCSVWLNKSECVAGSALGPTYKTDKNGNNIEVDNYYYLNRCYGNGC